MRREFVLVFPGLYALTVACNALVGIPGSITEDGGAGRADAGDARSAPRDAADDRNDEAVEYHDMTSPSFWKSFDLSKKNANAVGYEGHTFDGRYVYFAPDLNPRTGTANTLVARLDTTRDFTTEAAWTLFDLGPFSSQTSWCSAAFDGRYVYLIPCINNVLMRYDTTKGPSGFTNPKSWSSFHGLPGPCYGATFDGRYLYCVPDDFILTRYDTTASFKALDSYQEFGLNLVTETADSGGLTDFAGAVFDGMYVYLGPTAVSSFVRYDTRDESPFTDAGAWSTAMPTSLTRLFFKAIAYDGTFVYFGNWDATGATPPSIARFPKAAYSFSKPDDLAPWQFFDTTKKDRAATNVFSGGFDGRYVYFSAANGIFLRFDSMAAAFQDTSNWSEFDTGKLTSGGVVGTQVFDGRYMYLGPGRGSVVLRFDAKSPPSKPKLPAFSGSFF